MKPWHTTTNRLSAQRLHMPQLMAGYGKRDFVRVIAVVVATALGVFSLK